MSVFSMIFYFVWKVSKPVHLKVGVKNNNPQFKFNSI